MAFYDKYVSYCTKRGITPTAAAKELGLATSAVSCWKKRGSRPTDANIAKIARYFGCSIEDLLDQPQETKKEPAVTGELTPPSEQFLRLQQANELFLQLDDAGRAQALAYLKFLASQQEN